ncbi:type II toxin-antitoxin system RelE family toxin, partial [Enterobacter roggenkampii]|uniref:type II toxin-antitoxin system RelE family toxin n=1 Tax=Enterobacter roggenkampii TaxID=1812935 RepID=UPI0005EEA814
SHRALSEHKTLSISWSHYLHDCYKIKLRSSGYRLVYQVIDEKVVVFVISVGKRERSEVYSEAVKRIL